MTTMLEKAARAVWDAREARNPVGFTRMTWEQGTPFAKAALVEDVRAVLMSVRDVTEPVSWRALERLDGDACCFEFTYTRSREIHTAMIDAILEGEA